MDLIPEGMKKISIDNIKKESRFITRFCKPVKFVKFNVNKHILTFLLDEIIIETDESGKCLRLNNADSSITESNYSGWDVFVDKKNIGWININKYSGNVTNIIALVSPVYSNQIEALKFSTEETIKTIKIEWSE